jgi:hypothetical protein
MQVTEVRTHQQIGVGAGHAHATAGRTLAMPKHLPPAHRLRDQTHRLARRAARIPASPRQKLERWVVIPAHTRHLIADIKLATWRLSPIGWALQRTPRDVFVHRVPYHRHTPKAPLLIARCKRLAEYAASLRSVVVASGVSFHAMAGAAVPTARQMPSIAACNAR